MKYVADFSLALINKTGAYYICRDILQGLPHCFPEIRYWRFVLKKEPKGLVRKLLGRSMLLELNYLVPTKIYRALPGSRAPRTLFLDPLYVLRTDLREDDIVLCHDVGPISHPELFDRKVRDLYAAAYAKIRLARPGMVFVSRASHDEFCLRFGSDYRFLKVIPLYIRNDLNAGPEQAPPGITRPFFLTVAALETRKNHLRVMEAFAKSKLHQEGYSYVFCGPNGNSAHEVIARAREIPGVVRFGYLTDSELRWLYRRATGFILPSLLEGFGVPALEAAQFGALPLVSDKGAQREAVGDAAVLVDPLSIDSIAEGLRFLADLPAAERAQRLSKAQAHAAGLSQEVFIQRWSELLSAGSEQHAVQAQPSYGF
jgi:glycosyltransferase involved in cell wall biosynthesis